MHGFYINEESKIISFDMINDFNIKNREEVYKNIYDEIEKNTKGIRLILH